MLKHNSYFDGKVQSLGFEHNGRKLTAGVIDTGEFHFNTDGAERMTVVSGELDVKLPGNNEWRPYPAGRSFEIAQKSGFDVRARTPVAYLCEYL
jgi:purine/pyrimidine-nucleoside phosphorylase